MFLVPTHVFSMVTFKVPVSLSMKMVTPMGQVPVLIGHVCSIKIVVLFPFPSAMCIVYKNGDSVFPLDHVHSI